MSKKGRTCLHIEIPKELHDMIRKTGIDHDITVTKIMINYLLFLKKSPSKLRRLVDENTKLVPVDDKEPSGL
jgi:hypothetical protein